MDEPTENAQPEAPKAPHAGGRPTDYDPKFCIEAAELCIAGATDYELAEHFKIHVSTLQRWKGKHKEFRDAIKIGKELPDDRVVSSLYHRAVGYSFSAVKVMQNNGVPVIVPYTEHVPPDMAAITLWLTNRKGNEWKVKQNVNVTKRDVTEFSDEDLETLARGGEGGGESGADPAPGSPVGTD